MCRSVVEGGRRCSCGGADRRRAQARARYAARNAEAARRARNGVDFDARAADLEADMLRALGAGGEAVTSRGFGSVPDPVIEARYTTPMAQLSTQQRAELTAHAAARAIVAAAHTAECFAAVASRGPYADTEERRQYESALQEQGRHIAAIAAAELYEAMAVIDTDDQMRERRRQMAVDAGLTHPDGTELSVREVIEAARSGALDADAFERHRALAEAQSAYTAEVLRQRAAAHSAAVAAALRRADPELSFGTADLAGGKAPLRWGSGVTKAKAAQFADALHAVYPDRLIEHARDSGRPLRVRMTKARAHYQPKGAYDRLPAQNFVDTVDLVRAARASRDEDTNPLTRTAELRRRIGGATRLVVPRGSVPHRYAAADDTEDNRRLLQEVIDAWPTPEYDRGLVARMGSVPVIVERDGKLHLQSKKSVGTVDGDPVSELTTDGTTRCTVHEMAHRIEENTPAISAACHAFLARRTAGLQQSVYNISTRRRRRVVERVVEDSFVDPYIGKDYGPNQPHTEVFSVGMEALATGRFGGLNSDSAGMRADPEHRQLVLALLASAPRLLGAGSG